MSISFVSMMLMNILLLICCIVNIDCCRDISPKLDRIIRWTYGIKSPASEISFGVSLAKAILNNSNRTFHERFWELPNIRTNCSNHYNEIILDALQQEHFKVEQHLLHNMLISGRIESKNLLLINYLENIDDGVPSRVLSDICVAQISSTGSCVVSNECLNLIISNDSSKGYHKTHQLLFALLLKTNCHQSSLQHNINFRTILAKLCSAILHETRTIAYLQYPWFLRDLVLEQSNVFYYVELLCKSGFERITSIPIISALLCSLSGFTEYLNNELILRVLSWQTELGCFTTTEFTENNSCSKHMSALALAYLSLLMNRCDIEE